MVEQTRPLLVVDLEATCRPEDGIPRDEQETIEIGAVLLDAPGLATRGEIESLVRPVRHPRLSAFCTKLTTITQADVDAAPAFPTAFAELVALVPEPADVCFVSWGRFDRALLERGCRYHGLPYPFLHHINARRRFARRFRVRRSCGLRRALEITGLTPEGTPHRALSDARNLARLLQAVPDLCTPCT